MNKVYDIGIIKLKMRSNGFPEGFLLQRQLNIRECKHIMKNLLGIEIMALEDFYDKEEYNEYNQEIVSKVNGWLEGKVDDDSIIEFAYDCSDEQLGLFNMIPIIKYLQKIQVI